MYLHMAHDYLQTDDNGHIKKKIRSFQMPFKSKIEKGEKIEEQNYESFDHRIKGMYVPEPKTGITIFKNYDQVVKGHFQKKEFR
jgi:hypothetical protein